MNLQDHNSATGYVDNMTTRQAILADCAQRTKPFTYFSIMVGVCNDNKEGHAILRGLINTGVLIVDTTPRDGVSLGDKYNYHPENL